MDIATILSASGQNFLDPEVANRATGKSTLDANDFLRLLSVQLQSQDPLKPMEDTQFIAQMASFTSLEQMRGLAADFKTYTTTQRLATAQDYLGKIVTVTTTEGDSTSVVTGEVTAIKIEDDTAELVIAGKNYDPGDVTGVRPKSATDTTTPTTPPAVGDGPTAPAASTSAQ